MEWSFPKKVSGGHRFLSFEGSSSSGKKPKIGFESLVSAGLVSITTVGPLDSVKKSYPAAGGGGGGVMQNNMVPEKQGGFRYAMTSYPAPHLDAHSMYRSDVIMHPISDQTNATLSLAPSQKSHISPASLCRSVSSNALQLGEVSMTGAISAIPACTNVVGTTDLRNDSKSPVKAAQLTIFYNGSVCVYNDISPEKAQAIMLLAGNRPPSVPCSTPVSAAPVPSPALRASVIDGLITKRTHSMRPSSPSPISVAIPSHISFSSCVGSQSAGGPGRCLDITPLKSSSVLSISPPSAEPSKAVSMLGSFPDTSKLSVSIFEGVPQARKASLARFLDRRKGRIISTSPYAKKEYSDTNAATSTDKLGHEFL
ncbi:hypothetical protein Leryth_011523 [Lithospermum erythrorhizon]|nr:hypothetical protein Leryth_011523 [Lithospermum erythrorhizon]